MSTATIIVLSDSAGGEEAFGRVLNDDIERAGLPSIGSNPVPGTPGLPSLVEFTANGPVLSF